MSNKHDSFAVLGLSQFGYRIAVSLAENGYPVIAIDRDEKLVHKVSGLVTMAATADLTDWEVLEHLGVFDVQTAIVGLRSSFDVSVLLVRKLREQDAIQRIVAQVDTDEKAQALKIMGADFIVFPEKDMADRIVQRLTNPDLLDHISLSPNAAIQELPIPEKFEARTLIELDLRKKYGVYVIGIKHAPALDPSGTLHLAPAPDMRFEPGDHILVLGNREKLDRFVSDVT